VLRATRRAHGQMRSKAGELRGGVVAAEFELDVAVDDPAREPAARVAVIDRQERFERDR
jgi:hypothetical protein